MMPTVLTPEQVQKRLEPLPVSRAWVYNHWRDLGAWERAAESWHHNPNAKTQEAPDGR